MTLWVGALIASHQPANFGSHRHYGSGDIMFLPREDEILNTAKAPLDDKNIHVKKINALFILFHW